MQALLNAINEIEIEGVIVALEPVRFTPAGFPQVSLTLLHESKQIENGNMRDIVLEINVRALGEVTKILTSGKKLTTIKVQGFLAKVNLRSKQLVLHANKIERVN